MRYCLFIFKLPFSAERFCVGNNYMVGQCEKAQNGPSRTVEVLEDCVEEGGMRLHSRKLIHVDRALPAVLRAVYPKYAYTFEETSRTEWPFIESVWACPGAPGKYQISVRTVTKDSGDDHSLPDELR